MRPFQFRLQTKLDLTSREEQQIREELAILLRKRNQIKGELDEIKCKLNEIGNAMKDLMLQGFSLDHFVIMKDYLPVLREMLFHKKILLKEVETAIIETRFQLLQKMKERKILEKLREKEMINYQLELNREEQKNIDEIAINSHFRK